jgi:gamma-glutamyltranspeptidase / glutathione hydrolase
VFSIGAAGGSTIIATFVQRLINHVDFGMTLPAALAAPRVTQRNGSTSLAEPDLYNSPIAQALEQQYGEKFTLATGADPAARQLSGRRDHAAGAVRRANGAGRRAGAAVRRQRADGSIRLADPPGGRLGGRFPGRPHPNSTPCAKGSSSE